MRTLEGTKRLRKASTTTASVPEVVRDIDHRAQEESIDHHSLSTSMCPQIEPEAEADQRLATIPKESLRATLK